jgi:hypothetical protein
LAASEAAMISASQDDTLGAYQPNIFEIYERHPDMALSGTY